MTMRKIWIGSLISLMVAIVSVSGNMVGKMLNDDMITPYIIGANAAILFLDLLLTGAVTQIWKNVSPYRVFAISNIVIGICIASYAVYDIKTDEGFLAGIIGSLMLAFIVPFIVVLLVAELLIWERKKPKK